MTQGSLYTSHLSGYLLQDIKQQSPARLHIYQHKYIYPSLGMLLYQTDHAVAHSTIYTWHSRLLHYRSDATRRDDKRACSRQ